MHTMNHHYVILDFPVGIVREEEPNMPRNSNPRVLIGGRSNRRSRQPNSMPSRNAGTGGRRRSQSHNLSGQGPTNMDYGATALVSALSWLLYWSTIQANFAYDDR
ncbi:hypothetical protein CDAR_271791 [Caerostris darwini]|uniref:Uncharacterized protein n=1 Tax=Caerostris darwini TaxID=1538125 RepID=A0AAV4T2Q9_9ARAC|nr:hypothetical protein CDAR_271791 [Caerostris darwini]